MLSNKHLIAAMIIAPLLAVIAYYAVDHIVSERPHRASSGGYYPLAEKSNCRYESGECLLENGDFRVVLRTSEGADGSLEVHLDAAHPLDLVQIALAPPDATDPPATAMRTTDPQRRAWVAHLRDGDPQGRRLRLAIAAQGVYYFGDASTAFTRYHTTYERDFRRATAH